MTLEQRLKRLEETVYLYSENSEYSTKDKKELRTQLLLFLELKKSILKVHNYFDKNQDSEISFNTDFTNPTFKYMEKIFRLIEKIEKNAKELGI